MVNSENKEWIKNIDCNNLSQSLKRYCENIKNSLSE
jgi:hypothetical protein